MIASASNNTSCNTNNDTTQSQSLLRRCSIVSFLVLCKISLVPDPYPPSSVLLSSNTFLEINDPDYSIDSGNER